MPGCMDYGAGMQNAFTAVARIPKPVIAAVTGYALGGGLELALCADFRRGGRGGQGRPAGDPARHHPRRGRHPAAAAAHRPGPGQGHRVHRARSSTRRRRCASASRTRWCPTPRSTRRPGELAARYAGGPPLALRAAKQAIDEGLEADLDTGLEIERLHFAGLFATEDQRTGMRSFIENGPGKATFAWPVTDMARGIRAQAWTGAARS